MNKVLQYRNVENKLLQLGRGSYSLYRYCAMQNRKAESQNDLEP